MGRGPAVYLLMKKGSSTCSGLMGTAMSARRSLGTPASTSFRPVTASAAEKPIWGERVGSDRQWSWGSGEVVSGDGEWLVGQWVALVTAGG